MHILNFAHPLTPKQLDQITALVGSPPEQVREIKVGNQLASMHDKMVGFLDFGEDIYNKRQALLDVLRGE